MGMVSQMFEIMFKLFNLIPNKSPFPGSWVIYGLASNTYIYIYVRVYVYNFSYMENILEEN